MSAKNTGNNPRVVSLARQLGMVGHGDAVAYLVSYSLRTVDAWAKEFGPTTVHGLLQTVIAKVGLIVEYVRSDQDVATISSRYLREGEGGFARVPTELDDRTYALVLQLRKARHGCTHVAVIDCRGSKEAKRWFSVWHEVAHLLVQPQLAFDFRRTVAGDKDPMETAIDAIASELAFYRPMTSLSLPDGTKPSFAALELHRLQKSPDASLESSYATTIQRLANPALFLVADLAFKLSERREQLSGSLFPENAPVPHLRAVRVVGNATAAAVGLFIPQNIRVPERSVIARVFCGELHLANVPRQERLDWWESQGRRLMEIPIIAEAGLFGRRVFAIITRVS